MRICYTLWLAILLSGCAASKPKAHLVTELPPDCITSIQVTEKTHCYGTDAQHIKCDNVLITRNAGCERVVAVPNAPNKR